MRQAEPPELIAALAKLNGTFTSIAPTSHMFMDAMPQHSSEIRAEPAIGSKLKSTSNLRSAHRDTISDVLARFGDKIPEGQDATDMANQLRFAKEDTRALVTTSSFATTGAPSGTRAGGGFVPFQLGGGTLSKDDLTSTYGTLAAVPVDAEVKRLEEALRHATGAMGAVAHETLGFTKTKESKGLKDTVGAIITASGAEPILSSEYSRSHPFTPEVSSPLLSSPLPSSALLCPPLSPPV
jgi:hypothetical protein